MTDRINAIGELNSFIENTVKRLTVETTNELISTTPVDTGWARANWVPNIGVSRDETVGTRQQAEEGIINTSVQQTGIITVLGRYRLQQGSVFISNNVPYIVSLNFGSSLQAPAGFVQTAIARAIQRALSGINVTNPTRR